MAGGGRVFHIGACIGEGGFGEVYRAVMRRPAGLEREVAVKTLKPAVAPDVEAVRRLRDEARLLARLDHRAILAVHDLVRLDGRIALVTQLLRRRSALFSMIIGMFIMPLSAFCMAAGNLVGSESILGMHPIAFCMVVGIAFQGLAESFISPRFLEYFSRQAPKGQEGLYLGFSHLHSFVSNIVGFGLSGFLLSRYCPDPRTLPELVQQERLASLAGAGPMPAQYAHAHYIWFVFVGIAIASAVGLLAFGWVVERLDRGAATGASSVARD